MSPKSHSKIKKYSRASPHIPKRGRKLAIIALVVSLLALSYPLWPWFYFQLFHPHIDGAPYANAARQGGNPSTKPGNRLVIPGIGVDAQIFESTDLKILDTHDGVWHDKSERNPTTRGNMVIAGHRFRYLHHISNHFYNLPKLRPGAKLYVVWDKKVYEYSVSKTKTVTPDHIEIRNDHPAVPYELTLYTCTLFNSNLDRFVVSAALSAPAPSANNE
jgi:LPXTG-site transpeptidase (sortase) family protein